MDGTPHTILAFQHEPILIGISICSAGHGAMEMSPRSILESMIIKNEAFAAGLL